MDYAYFWICLFVFLTWFSYWKLIVLSVLLHVLRFYIFEHEKPAPPNNFKVCIVGAGFSGIGMAIKLKKLGIDYQIFESANEVGGTWFSNVYPGCACDIQSHLYSLSTDPNPDWSRKYPNQEEILEYMKSVVRRHQLKIAFNSKVLSARWLPGRNVYEVKIENGRTEFFSFLIYAAGSLREPVTAVFKDADLFKGEKFHSAQWNKNCDLTGKRVAVIGTGASSVQIVPAICSKVDQLYVYQRTPCWSLPRDDFKIPGFVKFMFRNIPGALWIFRASIFLKHELIYWAGFRTNSWLAPLLRKDIERKIRKVVKDPNLAMALTPTYAPGCKRITPSDSYHQAFNMENVHLITSPIDRFTPQGILTADGTVKSVDVIVYATGYSVANSFLDAFHLCNGKGQTLKEVMGDCPQAYLGISFPDFPNFYTLLGPGSILGHNSVLYMAECQNNYLGDLIRKMAEHKLTAVAPKRELMTKYQKLVEMYMENKVFNKGCSSWYRNKGGEGVNYALWPSNLFHYWWIANVANLDDYQACSE